MSNVNLSIFLIILLAASEISAQKEYEYERPPKVMNSDIKSYKLEEGRCNIQFKMNDGGYWNAALSIPDIPDEGIVPLVLALHWGGPWDGYIGYSECLAFPAFESLNAIIIAPSSDGKRWTTPKNEARVVDLMKKVNKHWPVDPERVIVTGYSNGGIGSWFLAKKYPKLFTTAIPIAGSYQEAKIKIPVYAIHGEMDELFNINEVSETIKSSIKKGSNIKFKIIPGFNHYDACAYLDELKEMVKLMQSEFPDLQR